VGYVARMGEMRNPYSILDENTERKRPLERSRCRWECNTMMVIPCGLDAS